MAEALIDAFQATGLPRHEWWALLEAATGKTREYWIAHPECTPDAAAGALLEQWIGLRRDGFPLAYLVGWREFYGRRFWVNSTTLIPRAETELLIDLGQALLANQRASQQANPLTNSLANPSRAAPTAQALGLQKESLGSSQRRLIADLGTGSGCIGITLALQCPEVCVLATDISSQALAVARNNAAWLGADNIKFTQGNWWQALPADVRLSGVISNPPYVASGDPHLGQGDLRFEPACALTGIAAAQAGDMAAGMDAGAGAASDGLDAYRQILAGIQGRLEPGGFVLVEHGHTQQPAVIALFEKAGLTKVKGYADAAEMPRAVLGFHP